MKRWCRCHASTNDVLDQAEVNTHAAHTAHSNTVALKLLGEESSLGDLVYIYIYSGVHSL